MLPRKSLLTLAVLTGLFGVSTLSAELPGPLTNADFEKLHKQLQPGQEEWSTIAWQVSVPRARQLAAKEKKPLLVWAQNGHPLGSC
jgi:hypothetical protein